MSDVDVSRLEQIVAETKANVGDGLLAMDIWDHASGKSLAAHNTQPDAIALFNAVTDAITKTISPTPFPPLARYYLLNLAADHNVVIMRPTESVVCGMLMNSTATDIGSVMGSVVPKVIEQLDAACG